MGGGTFPSAVKLTGANRAGIHTVIINGGECEPYLSCDDVLMRTQAAGIVAGVRLIVHASGAKRALIGIEDNKPEAIAAMQARRRRLRHRARVPGAGAFSHGL